MFFSSKNTWIKVICLSFALSSLTFIASAQAPQTSVKNIISKIDDYNAKLPAEKLYLQFDKPYYSVGDTIWFKGYILNAGLAYSRLSGRVNIDLVNDSNVVVKRYSFASAVGVTWGNITLDDAVFHEGGYTIRAYTNWMRNFGEESFFYKSFYLADPLSNPWIIGADVKAGEDSKNNVKADLKFTGLNKVPVENRDLDIKLMNGKKVLFRNNLQTGDDGILETNFNLPDAGQVKNLTIVATDKKDSRKKAVVPINVERAQDIDLQFMPEGGQLVTSLPSTIGFKAIGQDGRGVEVKGSILNKEGEEVTTFESSHKGMGVTVLVPQPGETYTAKITLANGDSKTVSLPQAKNSGTVIRVKNMPNRDSVEVSILATNDIVDAEKGYHFIAEARGVVCYGASIQFKSASTTAHIAKSVFPTGIAHLTLFNSLNQPINERLVFINNHDNLKINITTGKTYAPRDSIPMVIKVTDETGKPAVGSFSVAVTDNAQVKSNPDNSANILTGMLLSSELKGYVEDPSYYFASTDQSWKALDILLLTQGWTGYNWNTIIGGTEKVVYNPEPEFVIKGRVTNLFNKPIANTSVLLLGSGKYKMMRDTVVNNNGEFVFDKLPLIIEDTKFVLSAHTKKGRTINGGITVDDPTPQTVTTLYNTPVKPWYVNTDSTLLNYIKTNNTYRFELDKYEFGGHGRLLNAVNIRDRAAIKNSQNLNGEGISDQTISTQDMENAGKASLLDVIEQKVKGFREGYLPRSTNLNFFIKDKRVRFIIDGVDLERFYQPSGSGIPNEHYQYLKETLDYITAEDLLGIEVMYSARNVSNYVVQNLTADQVLAQNPAGPRGSETAFLEITTRSGNGPFMKRANGVYVYRPKTFSLPKEFYRPRYTVKNANTGFTDLRSTIYWNQHIVTNKNGEATLSFYAADKPTTYTVILEGANMMGKIGYQTDQIAIKK